MGFVGSAAPLGLGLLVALAWGARLTPAFVVGACMATMSTGIALNVLKAGSVINQPIGQLIIAAASVNELVNITLLTCVDNMMLLPLGIPVVEGFKSHDLACFSILWKIK